MIPEFKRSQFKGKKVGEILIELHAITADHIEKTLLQQEQKGGLFGEILMQLKIITEQQLLEALSLQSGLELIHTISDAEVDPALISSLPIQFAKQHAVIPLSIKNGRAIVAFSDPYDIEAFEDLKIILKVPLSPVIAQRDVILSVINHVYDKASGHAEAAMDELASDEDLQIVAQELEEPLDLLDASDEAPIIKLVNSLLFQAIKERASDIHIEPFEREISVRFRIDGVLYEKIKPPKRFLASIVSRVKIMAALDIAEKRLPQDGRIRIKIAGKDIDIRVSCIPTSYGERIVMRILDRSSILLSLEDIGFSRHNFTRMENIIRRPHGIILVTGPTGSGKTTTLYACLSKINSPDKNILTVEDPVEYQLKGVGQMQVSPKIGLTFASGLRSFLRQDPDVIMVGEIRDIETAEIAIQASLTGHLVMSTLHTNDAPSSITRLVDMGVEPFLVASSLIGILAQRLVRTVCSECKIQYTATPEEWASLSIDPSLRQGNMVYKGEGCNKCLQTGYTGRTGIYELMVVDDNIRSLISRNVTVADLKKAAKTSGMTSLKDDGIQKILSGKTSIAEVVRVTKDESSLGEQI